MHDYTTEILERMALGFFVKIDTEGALSSLGSAILPFSVFGLNRPCLSQRLKTEGFHFLVS